MSGSIVPEDPWWAPSWGRSARLLRGLCQGSQKDFLEGYDSGSAFPGFSANLDQSAR